MNEIEKLEKELKKHDKLYWEQGKPEISDEEYDVLVSKLKALDPNHPRFSKLEVQKTCNTAAEYKHKHPMLSLEKFYSKDEVIRWMRSLARTDDEQFKIQLKLDGMAAKLEAGCLSTRGDGYVGEDHTDKIKHIDFRFDLKGKVDTVTLGELIITDRFFDEHLKPLGYKNSRQAVAGLMGRKNPEEIEDMGITFVEYDVVSASGTVEYIDKNWDRIIEDLKKLGYPYDGIVVKLADRAYYERLGNKTKAPVGAIAYKFANKAAVTKVVGITAQVSRNGKLTPVVELEPVDITGITITRATGHNFKNLLDKRVKPGVSVVIERAGDVIPYLKEAVGVGGDSEPDIIPKQCPSCGNTKLKRTELDVFCENLKCPERMVENIVFTAMALDIEGLGKGTAEKLVKKHEVSDIGGLYAMTYEEIKTLEGFAAKSAKTLHDNIQNALKNITEAKFLICVGMEGIGESTIKKLLDHFKGIENMFDKSASDFGKVDGIGEITSTYLADIMPYVEDIYRLFVRETGILPLFNKAEESEDVDIIGTICFTGKMPQTRSFYEDLAKKHGYKPVDGVNKDLSILVSSEADRVSSKVTKAKKLGIKIMTLDEWMATVSPSSTEKPKGVSEFF